MEDEKKASEQGSGEKENEKSESSVLTETVIHQRAQGISSYAAALNALLSRNSHLFRRGSEAEKAEAHILATKQLLRAIRLQVDDALACLDRQSFS